MKTTKNGYELSNVKWSKFYVNAWMKYEIEKPKKAKESNESWSKIKCVDEHTSLMSNVIYFIISVKKCQALIFIWVNWRPLG